MRAATEILHSPAPFDAVAGVYDEVFSDSPIGRAQRGAVWKELDRVFRAGQRVLEINCGTGIDALHLARRGIEVFGCDAAPRMIAAAERRLRMAPEGTRARFRCLPTEHLDQIAPDEPYDGVVSNFSGLNCVADPGDVVRNLARLVRPGGQAVVCVFGVFCLWEVLWHGGRGDFRRAFRRFGRRGLDVSLSPSATVTVHYRPVRSWRRAFAPAFRLERRRGVGVATPPSYAGIRSLADHAVLVFRRTGEPVP